MLAEGLSGIPHLIRIGRRIHSRIVTWVLNKVIYPWHQDAVHPHWILKRICVFDSHDNSQLERS
jgi:hypothetical protein